jgi:hypothetical protein
MSKIAAAFAREPVMLGELVKSALTLGVAFGLNLTLDQLAALYGFVSLAGAFVVRAFVSPNKAPPSNGEPVAAVPQVKDEDAPPSTVRLAMLLGVLRLSEAPALRLRGTRLRRAFSDLRQ